MRGGGVRHPERAQRNIRLVFLFGAGGLGVSPRQTIEPSESAVPMGVRELDPKYLSGGRRLK
jgi:hypothetical protein